MTRWQRKTAGGLGRRARRDASRSRASPPVKDSDGGELESAHEGPVGQLQGRPSRALPSCFPSLVRRGGGGPAHDGARHARAHRPDGGLFPPRTARKNGGGMLLTSPIRSTRPSDLLIGADGAAHRACAHRSAQRYREIMVDEYQDTNEVQNCIFCRHFP